MFKAAKAAFLLLLLTFSANVFAMTLPDAHAMYRQLNLNNQIDFDKFEKAYSHFKRHRSEKPVFTLIDYSLPSSKKRFWVLDVRKRKVLFASYVSHGKNSGGLYAERFSNVVNSRKTSIGIFRAAETYHGRHGYSLRLDGLQKGINDNARRRAIVIHGASYANPSVIKKTGQLGRSWGCPALPSYLSKKVIDTIKNGTFIYAYG